MKTYIKEVQGLKIVVPYGKCSCVNYNPEEIKIMTHENIDFPICNNVSIVSNGFDKNFQLAEKFTPSEWVRSSPWAMIKKAIK